MELFEEELLVALPPHHSLCNKQEIGVNDLEQERFILMKEGHCLGDQVNRFDWARKADYADVHDYARGLVALRRAHPAFRMDDDEAVRRAVRFLDGSGPVAFTIDGSVTRDPWNMILVAYNGEPSAQELALPGGDWEVVVDAKQAGLQPLSTARNAVAMPPYSMIVARRR